MGELHELRVPGGTIRLAKGDITTFDGDAIVNAANSGLMGGGGVDGAIHRAAGPKLYAECKAIVERRGPLPAGQAVATSGGRLPAAHVIHTVGPIWRGGNSGEAETLASAYTESVRVAREVGAHRIAFPSISTGAYGYPLRPAADVALRALRDALLEGVGTAFGDMDVTVVLYDHVTYEAYASALEGRPGEA